MSKGDRTRQTILDEALSLASTLGLEQLSIGGLASAVGLSKSGLFAHFKSKEQLQIQVLATAVDKFIMMVVVPAIREPRGEPRVRAMFNNWLSWSQELPGGCVIQSAAMELDDRPGPVRDFLEQSQRAWIGTISKAVRIAVDEGHFRADLDIEQWAFEFVGIALSHQHHRGLLRDPNTDERTRRAFESLLSRSR